MARDILRDQRVVVLGGSSGIGYAVAQRVLDEGACVVIGSSNAGKVEAARARLGANAAGFVVDVRDEASVAAFFDNAGSFDHLVFTAGDWAALRTGEMLADVDLGSANAVFAVRFWGALAAIKYGQRHISKGGSITITDGMVAHRPRKGAVLNTAMAGAVEHVTRALAVELAPLRVNAVCPGLVLTEAGPGVSQERREAQMKQRTERQPLPRPADPGEIAEAYIYLMRGGYSTGQVLIVDGGMSLI